MSVQKQNTWDSERQHSRGPKRGTTLLRIYGRIQALGSFHSFRCHSKQRRSIQATVLPKIITVFVPPLSGSHWLKTAVHSLDQTRLIGLLTSVPRNLFYHNRTKRSSQDFFALDSSAQEKDIQQSKSRVYWRTGRGISMHGTPRCTSSQEL